MTEEEMKELNGLAASMGLYDDKNPCKRAVILGKAIKELEQEPCDDAISRQAVLDYLDKMPSELTSDGRRMVRRRTLEEFISDTLPSVTPQAKTGRWIAYEVRLPDRTILNYRCSVCGRKLIGYNTETLSEVPFCHCGAKMQAESE